VFPDFQRWLTAEKALAAEPWWYFDSPAEDRYVLSVPLAIDHVVEEGLFLEGNSMRNMPDREITFLINYKPPSGCVAVERMRWRWAEHLLSPWPKVLRDAIRQ
jgi:hypothetical protein